MIERRYTIFKICIYHAQKHVFLIHIPLPYIFPIARSLRSLDLPFTFYTYCTFSWNPDNNPYTNLHEIYLKNLYLLCLVTHLCYAYFQKFLAVGSPYYTRPRPLALASMNTQLQFFTYLLNIFLKSGIFIKYTFKLSTYHA